MPRESRIFIVDNQPVFCQGLTQAIDQEPDLTVCGQADNVTEALEAIESLKPDLATVDIVLEGNSGLELLKELQTRRTNLPCLVLSMQPESRYAHRAIRVGARGYITTQEAVSEIITGIRGLLKGDIHFKASLAMQLLGQPVDLSSNAAGSAIHSLSKRQFEVFNLIGQGYSVRQIAKTLHVSVKTIETHQANIKDKLNLASAKELFLYAVQWVESGKF